MKKYDEVSVVRVLNNNPGIISINTVEKVIKIAKDARFVGNKTNGKIDFLINYCGYLKSYIDINEEQKERLAEIAARKAAKKAINTIQNKKIKKVNNTDKFNITSIVNERMASIKR